MEEESDLVPNECGRRDDGGVDRISQLPDETIVVILSFLRFKEAAATTVLSSRWLDLWKRIPHIKFDRISQLPNQIIAVILSFLSIREAATTSVLSSRWSDLWKHTPNLEFDKDILSPNSDDDENSDDDDNGLCEAERCKYIETVNSVIRSHKALSLKKFRISLFVEKSDKCAVPKWLKFVLSRQVESLELNNSIDGSDMGVFKEWLREESIICRAPETLVFFQSLKRLCLKLVNVSGEDIKLFLWNCPLLEQLMIQWGFLTSDVEVCGANLMLKYLEILELFRRGEPKSIKVSAPNLTRIKFSDVSGTLSFENVPKLVEAYFATQHFLYNILLLQHLATFPNCKVSSCGSIIPRCFG